MFHTAGYTLTQHVVRGVSAEGEVRYYTGKAGEAGLSPNRCDAFTGFNLEGARRKAKQFNTIGAFPAYRFCCECITR